MIYPFPFESLQSHKGHQSVRWKCHDPERLPSAWGKARNLMSCSDNLAVDVMIQAIPRYCPICPLLNQFWSPLSTSTSMSLRLNSSDSLLALETFNKEEIFIYSPFGPKIFLHPLIRHKKVYVYPHNLSVSFFHLKPVCCIILRGRTYFLSMAAKPWRAVFSPGTDCPVYCLLQQVWI